MIEAILEFLIKLFMAVALGYFLLLNGFYFVTMLLSLRVLRRYSTRMHAVDLQDLISRAGAPPVTVIAPAYNESKTCVEAMGALLGIKYEDVEVLFVNDGSKDDTMARMSEAFDLVPASRAPTSTLRAQPVCGIYRSRRQPNLWVIDKENGGKADALNAGLNYSQTPLFCSIDADSMLEPDAILRAVLPFLEDARTAAVGGVIRIANDSVIHGGRVRDVRLPKKLLVRFQVLEYMRAFLSGRLGWSELGGTLIISGAFGVFKRALVVDAGGYRVDTVGEDMELIVRLHRHCREKKIPYQIVFSPDPVSWTEAPETVRQLGRQRERWQRGLTETLLHHRGMMLNPRYGVIGMVAFPYYALLEMSGPLIEFIGYILFVWFIATGRFSEPFALAFFAVAIVLGMAMSVFAVALGELSHRRYPRFRDLMRLLLDALVENLGYRQMQSWFRLRGLIRALRKKTGWGTMERKGFTGGGSG